MNKMLNKIKDFKHELLVLLFFIFVRLPSLGHDTFNTDVWKWKTRIFNFGSGVFGLDFAQTIQKYHPGVTLMWLGTIGVKLNAFYYKVLLGIVPPDNDINAIFTLHFIQKLVIVVFLAFVLASMFFVLKNLISHTYAWVFIILLSFEPFYAGLTRVVHLEGLLSTLMLGSFVWGYYYIINLDSSKNKNALILSSLFAALAILTKTSALFLIVFMPFMYFTYYYFDTNSVKTAFYKSYKPIIYWTLILLSFVVILWPALWVIPLEALAIVSSGIFDTGVEEGHSQLYFSRYVQNPGISFYFVVLLLRSSLYLIFGALGFIFLYKTIKNILIKRFFLYAFLFALLYLIGMSLPSKKLDRYLLPSFVSLMFLASYTFYFLIEKANSVKYYLRFIILLLPAIFTFILVHPDYFSYYNPIFGGLKTGEYVIEPKWIIGVPEINKYFQNIIISERYTKFLDEESFDTLFAEDGLDNKLIIGFPEKYYTQIYPFIQDIGARAIIKDLTPHAKVATYFVYPVWEDDSYKEDRFDLEYINTIKIRNTPAYNVYKRVTNDK